MKSVTQPVVKECWRRHLSYGRSASSLTTSSKLKRRRTDSERDSDEFCRARHNSTANTNRSLVVDGDAHNSRPKPALNALHAARQRLQRALARRAAILACARKCLESAPFSACALAHQSVSVAATLVPLACSSTVNTYRRHRGCTRAREQRRAHRAPSPCGRRSSRSLSTC